MHRIVIIGQRASASPAFSLVDLPGTSGRLDVLVRCLRAALLVSHGLRQDATVYLVMLGDPLAPRTLRIDGSMARFLRPDERQLAILVQKALVAVPPGTSADFSPMRRGIDVADGGVETVLRDCAGSRLFVLDERGNDVRDMALDATGDCTFFIGDHMGFDAQTSALLASAGAAPLCLGPVAIHAEDAVAVLWNELDRRISRAAVEAAPPALSCAIPQRMASCFGPIESSRLHRGDPCMRQIWRTLALLALVVMVIGCRRGEAPPMRATLSAAEQKVSPMTTKRTFTKPSLDELQRTLSPLQFMVTQNDATEPPFRNAFWDNHHEGLYVDVTTGEPLFSSSDKFDSGTGWPSFTRPVDERSVKQKLDVTHGMRRVEVRSAAGDAHLGHVFDDGPGPSHLRFCINSASLRFIPVDRLEVEGYGEYKQLFGQGAAATTGEQHTDNACAAPAPGETAGCQATLDVAILAGGCFWGMEELIRAIPGVLETEVGYTGGETAAPTYEDVKTGRSGHAEAIKVTFDPSKLAYADLLEQWFFKMHDPTTLNRQGNDIGTQYRSAIFFTSEEQKRIAEEVKAKIDASGKWKRPIVTAIVSAGPFTAAEGYHQDYLQKHPGGYTCHFMRD